MSLLRRKFWPQSHHKVLTWILWRKGKLAKLKFKTSYTNNCTIFLVSQSYSQDDSRLQKNKTNPTLTSLTATCITGNKGCRLGVSCDYPRWEATGFPILPSLMFSLNIRQWPLHVFVLSLYTLTSVSIFCILFSAHFQRCWQGEFL